MNGTAGNGTTNATATPNATQTTEEPAGTTGEPTTTSGEGPGFGVIVALVALVGAALLAVRRTN